MSRKLTPPQSLDTAESIDDIKNNIIQYSIAQLKYDRESTQYTDGAREMMIDRLVCEMKNEHWTRLMELNEAKIDINLDVLCLLDLVGESSWQLDSTVWDLDLKCCDKNLPAQQEVSLPHAQLLHRIFAGSRKRFSWFFLRALVAPPKINCVPKDGEKTLNLEEFITLPDCGALTRPSCELYDRAFMAALRSPVGLKTPADDCVWCGGAASARTLQQNSSFYDSGDRK